MSATTTPEERAGVLVAVISGGRPELKQRPVHRLLPAADGAVMETVWVVSDADAETYEEDPGHPLAVYPREWAEEYAAAHWMLPTPPEPGGFLGAFPGREWACREAERRGCWAVLQLDDNIDTWAFLRRSGHSMQFTNRAGGLALFLDLFAAVALATNARTVGAQLDSVSPSSNQARQIARPGFPYSCFLERVGEGREEWYGPFEDDITHSLQYGARHDGATAAVMPLLHYHKEPKSKSGMRQHYNHTRAVQLQRCFPQAADIAVRRKHSNGRGEARVFHQLRRGAIRNPLVVRDQARYAAVGDTLTTLIGQWYEGEERSNREKARRRGRQAVKLRAEKAKAEKAEAAG